MKRYVLMIALLGTVSLSACMPFSASQTAQTIYTLHGPPAPQRQVRRNVLYVIAVQDPKVPSGFDTNKIALYLYNKRRLDYYKDAAWPEPLSKVVGDVILQSARTLPDTMAVAAESGLPATHELRVKVNDLEPIYTAGPTEPPQLRVSLSFRLVSPANKKILLEATYSATAWATENTRTAIVSGLEALLLGVNRQALREIRRSL